MTRKKELIVEKQDSYAFKDKKERFVGKSTKFVQKNGWNIYFLPENGYINATNGLYLLYYWYKCETKAVKMTFVPLFMSGDVKMEKNSYFGLNRGQYENVYILNIIKGWPLPNHGFL